jgi:AraC-like DNA-binding protein
MSKQTPRPWTEDFYRAVNPRLNLAGYSRIEPAYFGRTTKPVNPDFDLWYVEAGRGEVFLDRRWHECSAGDVIVIKPGQRYEKERAGPHEPWQVFFVHLWPFGDALSPYNRPLAERLPTRIRFEKMPRLRDFFSELFEAWTLRHEGYLMEVKALAIRVLEVVFAAVRGEPRSLQTPSYARLLRAHDYLVRNSRIDLSIDDLADHADLSASYLSSLFVRYYGCPPIQYQIDLRLRSAKLLLAKGERVGDVAEQVGFHSVHYFSRIFKRRLGLAPTQFAQQCRQK